MNATTEPEDGKRVQVPIKGGPDQNDIDRVMLEIVRLGIKRTTATSLDEESRPSYKRPGPALLLWVPEDMSLGEVQHWVEQALRNSKLDGKLSAGKPIALE